MISSLRKFKNILFDHNQSDNNDDNSNNNDYNKNINKTNEISLWPCLKNFSPNSIEKFYPFDNGHSMFVLLEHNNDDDRNNDNFPIKLYLNGSNDNFIRNIKNSILLNNCKLENIKYLFSNSSNYLFILTDDNRFLLLSQQRSHDYQLNLIEENVSKLRTNGKQCLAIDLDGNLKTRSMTYGPDRKLDLKKFLSFDKILETNNLIDIDCVESYAIVMTCSSDYRTQAVHIWPKSSQIYIITIQINYSKIFWEIIAGIQTFILVRDGLIRVFNYQNNANHNRLNMITEIPEIIDYYNIPSTDIYILISKINWYVYNGKTNEKIRTLLRSLPDLFTFYGRHSTTPPLFCYINWSSYSYQLITFNNPFLYDFCIQIPFDRYTTRTIYLLKNDLINWKFYFRNLFEQYPNLKETSELTLNIGFIEHYYYYKSIFIEKLPLTIENDVNIQNSLIELQEKHEKFY